LTPFLTNPFVSFPAGCCCCPTGSWVELDRTTLTCAGDLVTVSCLPDKRHYMVLSSVTGDGATVGFTQRVGNGSLDTASNYAERYMTNGATEVNNANQDSIEFGFGGVNALPNFKVDYWSNISGQEKLQYGHVVLGNTGAGAVPSRSETIGKWDNTASPITDITAFNPTCGCWAACSQVVVLGWDECDTHTTACNFWVELADVTLACAGDNLSSGTITAKKYLKMQAYIIPCGTVNALGTYNNDTCMNYAWRFSDNGTADTTGMCSAFGFFVEDSGGTDFTTPAYVSSYIINVCCQQKLSIQECIVVKAAGAGNVPARDEQVGKWSNSVSQITEIEFDNSQAGSFDVGSRIKVWGSD